jgi:hypothetical protein
LCPLALEQDYGASKTAVAPSSLMSLSVSAPVLSE